MDIQSILTALAFAIRSFPAGERNDIMIRFGIEVVENYDVPLEEVRQTFVNLDIPMLENEYHWPIEDLD